MAARPRAVFAHTKTVRLLVDDGMDTNAIEIIKSLPDFRDQIAGIVPNFGGKSFDITLKSSEAAARLATSGFDYGAERKPLKLLGAKTIHVSVFVAVEFPDEEVLKILKAYGCLKSDNLRRLYYTEEGCEGIERGIRVAEFLALDRDVPRKLVTQGLELFFKYSGQPLTCYRCGSADHVVRNCPKQRARFGHIRVEDRVLSDPPNPPDPQVTQESAMDTADISTGEPSSTPQLFSEPASGDSSSSPPSFTSVTASSPDPSLATASRELFESRKRPPLSPEKAETPAPKEQRGVEGDGKTAQSIREFLRALKKTGSERSQLMSKISGPEYYRARAHYLQYKHGNFAVLDLKSAARRGLSDRETDAWEDLHGLIGQDAFAVLVRFSEDIRRKHPGLFPTL